jgi:glycosyltransferase AglD
MQTLMRTAAIVTVPVRNEAPRIVPALSALRHELDNTGYEYTLSIAEDGSTDGSQNALKEAKTQFPALLVQHYDSALGRGKALRLMWSTIEADAYCFTDADLSSGIAPVAEVLSMVRSGCDIVVGSRYVTGASVSRPPLRALVSRSYNKLVRQIFQEDIQDHQCGLKAFSSRAIHELLPLTKEDSWFWDTEILVMASKMGYKITELPVKWIERKSSRTSLRRLWSDVWLHGTGIIRLRSSCESAVLSRRIPAETSHGIQIPSPRTPQRAGAK